ncbi:flavodoxin family protein [Mycetocola manganoxydans]|uniref:Flavodoxin family protein n=1 Tax=Mycetocola manganoxydans TaxID=699879 RepID=A0A3L6ZIW8_9MICO|nr:NAD(P)H-dependent oxidoreductase [Mycetocola manganoxydans]RLP67860.1 flavodoxin family protein [Mycetocola manganoxydans]GHD51426.1 flavodoxin [Mycetocola manganoxydans]
MDSTSLTALALVCTLTPSPDSSSSDLLADQFLDALGSHGVSTSKIRVVDHDVKPGVQTDMGNGDEWPSIRERVLAADILLISTPTWAGHMSSVASRVVERLDAELSETDAAGRPILYDKVALVAVVGNEDGAHKISADLFQALNDYGFTIPAQGVSYWNGEAMHTTDYKDLDSTPEVTASALSAAAANAVHLAGLLRSAHYPKPG